MFIEASVNLIPIAVRFDSSYLHFSLMVSFAIFMASWSRIIVISVAPSVMVINRFLF